MGQALELLNNEITQKSMGIVARELKISKATVSLVANGKYPNPQRVYTKVLEVYGDENQEIIGAETNKSAAELLKELG